MPLKILIADAYTTNGRKGIVGAGGSRAGAMFSRAIRHHRPDAEIETVVFDTAEPDMPGALEAFDGVLWSGSNLTIHRRNALIDAQVDMARACFDRGIPQFGCCYGLQLGTVAAGGEVEANPNGVELGWARDVTLTGEGRAHPMYDGKAGRFHALCWHNDAVKALPADADLLATNTNSKVQAAILRRGGTEFWATQYHLEFDGAEVASLVDGFAPSIVEAGTMDEDAVAALVKDMRHLAALAGDPASAPPDLAPVVDPALRTAELGNWLAHVEAAKDRR
jgi:GMP synthase (glutamine-hydrolysing)